MTTTATPVLALVKPTPGTNEAADVSVINANMDKIDAAFGSLTPSFRNKIRNGDFGVAQRGTGPFTAAGYGLDGWLLATSGGTLSASRVVNTLGNPAHLAGAKYGHQVVTAGQAAAGDLTSVSQRIEGVETFAGKQVTLSFKAKAGAGTPKIGVECVQNFGTGGAPSAAVSTPVSAVTISTTEVGYSVTFNVPSIAGKTLGSNGDDYLGITLWLSAGSTNATKASAIGIQNSTITLYDVQLEQSAVATTFERLSQQMQLAWCQRYFWRCASGGGGSMFGNGQCTSTTTAIILIPYPVPMRAVPTRTLNQGASMSLLTAGGGSAGYSTATMAATQRLELAKLDIGGSAGLAAGNATNFYDATGTAGCSIDFSAEL